MELMLGLTFIAATASIIGAAFAIWRWSYAVKAYDMQKLQVKVQVMMLIESREYWKTPKMTYVGLKKVFPQSDKELVEFLKKRGLLV